MKKKNNLLLIGVLFCLIVTSCGQAGVENSTQDVFTEQEETTSDIESVTENDKDTQGVTEQDTQEKETESETETQTISPDTQQNQANTQKPSTQKPENNNTTGNNSQTPSTPNTEEDNTKPQPDKEFENPISLEPVAGLKKDFLFGCDMSTLIAQEKSGVVYYNEAGIKQDPLLTLAENGVNMVRVRVWNDPYDANGNGYGGGNCDTANAIAIGKRATSYNMTCFIDFHYSDFWADPAKQMCPKAWKNMDMTAKTQAIYDYTKESLGQILAAGVDVSLVQIGNEITSGMSGETDWKNISTLLNSASKAVRELSAQYSKDIKIAVHFTNPEKPGRYANYAKTLNTNKVDYDVFATSYYSYWHGTLDNLKSVLGNIADTYHKKVMVAEIAYAYTNADGDGHGNTIHSGAWGEFNYDFSEQGQANAVRDCVETLVELGDDAIGICYWEPAWIPVPNNTGMTRAAIWEKFGSGWASSFAGEYDAKDAGQYYGGSAWDNQALFDFNGYPLSSIEMFEKMRGN